MRTHMSDADLEAALTEWGRAARSAAGRQPMPDLTPRARSPRHFGWQLAAGVTAVAVAAALAVGLPKLLAKNNTDPLHGITSTASAPPGFQVITYHGLSITVPTSWLVSIGMACPAPSRNLIVLPGTGPACLPTEIAIVEFGGLQPMTNITSSRQVSIDGVPAVRLEGDLGRPAVAYVVASLKASVLIYPTASQPADDLAAGLRVNAVDVHGCRSRISNAIEFPPAPTKSGAVDTLIPGQPESMRSCRYEDGWLEQGGTLSGAVLRSFVTTVNGLPPGLSRAGQFGLIQCPGGPSVANGEPPPGPGDLYRFEFHYPDGPSVLVTARVGWCGVLGISNGSRSGQLTDALLRLLSDTVGVADWPPVPITPAR
jgi:hypothetical protein